MNHAHPNGLGTTPAFAPVCRFHAAQPQGLSLVPGETPFSAMAPVHPCTARRQHLRTRSKQDAVAANPAARVDWCFRDQRDPVEHTKCGRTGQSEQEQDVRGHKQATPVFPRQHMTSTDTRQTSPRKLTPKPGELTAVVDEFLDVVADNHGVSPFCCQRTCAMFKAPHTATMRAPAL